MVRVVLSCLLAVLGVAPAAADSTTTSKIKNPYYEKTTWKLWRVDPTPVPGVKSLTGREKKSTQVTLTLQPPPPDKRLFPLDVRPPKFMAFGPATNSRYAGMWDDVYASWSGLHGYVRPGWKDHGGNALAGVKEQIMHLVDHDKAGNLFRLGVNFYHQSTTGMANTLTNTKGRAEGVEKIYFAAGLITSPAHASYTEAATRTHDLYLALVPTMFNSVGSSNSETMAITKMIAVGAHLPAATKLRLKRHGLYPSALLYIWKAALPYDVPYDHELRHRIAYNAVGARGKYPERYGYAGSNRGDAAAAFHRYDDSLHMQRMVAMARQMTVTPPETVLEVKKVDGGTLDYALAKTVLVRQENDTTVTLRVSVGKSYDLADRPLTHRWSLLYGDRRTTVVREGDSSVYRVTVPCDPRLPEGRTTLICVASNGVHDSNPAVVNVFRQRGELPPSGQTPKDYKYPSPRHNRRPVVVGLGDRSVRPGETVTLELTATDPEGFPVTWHRRAGDPGELDGTRWSWRVPRDAKGSTEVALIASDGTSGNGYAGRIVKLTVGAPAAKIHAALTTRDPLVGTAPLRVRFSARGSYDKKGRLRGAGWFVGPRPKGKGLKGWTPGGRFAHRFSKPGLHPVHLRVTGPSGEATTTVQVLVRDKVPPGGTLEVVGKTVPIAAGDDSPTPFEGTDFGAPLEGSKAVRRTFLLRNGTSRTVRPTVSLKGSRAFSIVAKPRRVLGPGDATSFAVRFTASGSGEQKATVTVKAGSTTVTFTVAGRGR